MRKRRVTKNKSKAAILWMWEHTKLAVFPGRDCGCDKGNRAIQLPRYSYRRNE